MHGIWYCSCAVPRCACVCSAGRACPAGMSPKALMELKEGNKAMLKTLGRLRNAWHCAPCMCVCVCVCGTWHDPHAIACAKAGPECVAQPNVPCIGVRCAQRLEPLPAAPTQVGCIDLHHAMPHSIARLPPRIRCWTGSACRCRMHGLDRACFPCPSSPHLVALPHTRSFPP